MSRPYTNKVSIHGENAIIKTFDGYEIIVDAMVLPYIVKHFWCVSATGYAVAKIGNSVVLQVVEFVARNLIIPILESENAKE